MRIKLESDIYTPPVHGLRLLQIAIAFLFIIFCARFWYLQVHRGEEFVKLALENKMRYGKTFPARGEIYDRNGLLLAENHIAFAIALVREDSLDIRASLAQISEWAELPLEVIEKRYNYDKNFAQVFDPIFLVQDLPFELIAPIQSQLHEWPGIQIIPRPVRNYPQKNIFAHIMGYVAEAKTEELEKNKNLALGDIVGRQGLESVLESDLRGKKSLKSMEVDVFGRILKKNVIQEAQDGNNIILNLDANLQQKVAKAMGEYSGSVIVLEPDTGYIRAFVTQPSYDNNLFVTGFSQKEWDAVLNDPRSPLQNRTIQSVFPPGSVWKLMIVGMLLENDIDPKETVYCSGSYTLGDRVFRCWRKGGHGKVDMELSVVSSCDVYYFAMGERLGIDLMESFAKACGFGSKTGIDLPYENSGLVPSRSWKRRRLNERWQTGDTINASIGQGYTLVTPIQLAVFIGSLINGGKLLKPQLIASEKSYINNFIPIRDEYKDLIRKYMIETVEAKKGATARVLKRKDVTIGAKTGTAQVTKIKMIGDRRIKNHEMKFYERDHAWMGAWGEKDGRRFVVVTMLEHGGGGASAAGPVTRDIFALLFPTQNNNNE